MAITEVLKKGRQGAVWLGIWRGLQVAVRKVGMGSGEQLLRVVKDAAVTSQLSHPLILNTYTYDLQQEDIPEQLLMSSIDHVDSGGDYQSSHPHSKIHAFW